MKIDKGLLISIAIGVVIGMGVFVLIRQIGGADLAQKEDSGNINDNISTERYMKITSPEFEINGFIPARFTCDGEDINPTINITEVSDEAKTLTLLIYDPDAPGGNFDHWAMWNIPASESVVIEEGSVPEGAVLGRTDFGKNQYGGPCPPSSTHRYFFHVYALDTSFDLQEGSLREEIEEAMQYHIIAQAMLVGLYQRQ